MWSCVAVLEGSNEGSTFTRSAFRVLRNVAALRRQVLQTKPAVSDEKRDGRRCCEMKDVAIAMVA